MNGIQPLQPGLSRPKPWRLILWSAAALLLLVPVVAMPFTAQMNWGAEDFFAAAALICGAGLAIELAFVSCAPPPIAWQQLRSCCWASF